jgi:hypothetical protein
MAVVLSSSIKSIAFAKQLGEGNRWNACFIDNFVTVNATIATRFLSAVSLPDPVVVVSNSSSRVVENQGKNSGEDVFLKENNGRAGFEQSEKYCDG